MGVLIDCCGMMRGVETSKKRGRVKSDSNIFSDQNFRFIWSLDAHRLSRFVGVVVITFPLQLL